jgi:putative hydrolase of HD superfamily
VEYERAGEGELDLGEFSRVAERIQLDEVKVWAEEVLRERREFWESKGIVPSFARDIGEGKKESQDRYYGIERNGDREGEDKAE